MPFATNVSLDLYSTYSYTLYTVPVAHRDGLEIKGSSSQGGDVVQKAKLKSRRWTCGKDEINQDNKEEEEGQR